MSKKQKNTPRKTQPATGKARRARPIPRDAHIEEPSLRDMPLTIWNLPRYLILALIRGYQATFSKTLPVNACRFYPSCSHYGYMAIYKHGAIKGSLLAAWRVLRCNPFNPGGYDPVP